MVYDYVIIGGGVVGIAIAKELSKSNYDIAIIEKEHNISLHASGRNSGVLHAGFYYTADSLKAKFTRDGNKLLRDYCKDHKLSINHCGKLVIAQDKSDIEGLHTLKKRGDVNGVELEWVSANDVCKIDPNVYTYESALYSPTTATVDPVDICRKMKHEFLTSSTTFKRKVYYNCEFKDVEIKEDYYKVICAKNTLYADRVINCAGLYADKVAHKFGVGLNYALLPFKGLYLKSDKQHFRTNVYPVPNLNNPFLGVHFTVTVDGTSKLGPTATPGFWRENYGWGNFNFSEMREVLEHQSRLFLKNSFGFRGLAIEELKKYRKRYFKNLAKRMVKDPSILDSFTKKSRPGIRAQLLDLRTDKLVQDFVVETSGKSIHILNAVSPAFTCSMPIAKYVVDNYIREIG